MDLLSRRVFPVKPWQSSEEGRSRERWEAEESAEAGIDRCSSERCPLRRRGLCGGVVSPFAECFFVLLLLSSFPSLSLSLALSFSNNEKTRIYLTWPFRTSGPSLGAALSGATTAEAVEPLSGAPEGPTSFFETGTMMRPRFCEDDELEEAADDATIVAERCARITLACCIAPGREWRKWLLKKREEEAGATTA